jgi:hypothetical protein
MKTMIQWQVATNWKPTKLTSMADNTWQQSEIAKEAEASNQCTSRLSWEWQWQWQANPWQPATRQ